MAAKWSVSTTPMRAFSYKKAAHNEQLNTETRAEKLRHVFSNREEVLIRFSASGGHLVRAQEKPYHGSLRVDFHMPIIIPRFGAVLKLGVGAIWSPPEKKKTRQMPRCTNRASPICD